MSLPCLFSLGSNEGNSIALLQKAISMLRERLGGLCVSPTYLSSPVDVLEQPPFYNLCATGRWHTDALELLGFCKNVERQIGRPKAYLKGPREIDIDIIFLGDLTREEDPILPHPRYHRRLFVIRPLLDLWPEAFDPKRQSRVDAYLKQDFYGQTLTLQGRLIK